MFNHWWSIITLVLVFSGPALADEKAEALADIKANCKAEWSTDYSMQEYCIGGQVKAINAVSKVAKSSLSVDERGILDKCISDWSKARGADWMMVSYCYNEQHEAYVRLQN
jgi:hypothetical protein